jgi:NAD(P)H dehydrogenase (quinone)
MSSQVIGVTGATGGLGGRVAARLADAGIAQRLLARDPGSAPVLPGAEVVRFAGYHDGESMRRALDGVDTLLFVSAAEDPDRVSLHATAVDAAAAAGVRRLVYTSFVAASPDATFTYARDHFHTEEHIRASGLAYTFLRHNLYIEYIPQMCPPDGVIRGPAGDGRAALVSRDDLADVATVVLTGHGHDGRTYDVTGAEALTMGDAAAELSRVTRRQITYESQTLDEARESRKDSEAPDWMIEGWVSSYAAIAAGDLEEVAETVEELSGHQPKRLGDWLREHPEAYRHLLATA